MKNGSLDLDKTFGDFPGENAEWAHEHARRLTAKYYAGFANDLAALEVEGSVYLPPGLAKLVSEMVVVAAALPMIRKLAESIEKQVTKKDYDQN